MSFISVIRKYNVEPIIFLFVLARAIYMPTPLTQLLTDKICANTYHLDPKKFCYYINEPELKETTEAHTVQKDVVQYVMYQQFILSIPSIVAAIFLGPWLDMHSIAPKIALIGCLIAGLFESCSLLLNVIYFEEAHVGLILLSHILNGITGANMIFMTAIFTIAMKETPLHERTLRFTIIEFAMVLPNPIGNLVSSFILPSTPWLIENQVRNYVPILMMASFVYLTCLVITCFVIGEVREICSIDDTLLKRLSVRTSIQPMTTEYLCVRNNSIIDPSLNYVNSAFERDFNDKGQRDFSVDTEKHNSHDRNNNNFLNSQKDRSMSFHRSLPIVQKKNASAKEIFTSLFQLRNASAMFKSLFKKREEKAHILLWMTTAIYVLTLICANGIPLIMVPFVTVVYGMKPNLFMKIESVGHLVFGFSTTFVLVILHRIKLNDTMSLMIGLVSLFLLNLLRGAVLYPIGLYVSYVVGSLYLCSIVACRGFVSKCVPENEIGCVLGMLSCFFATSPIFASLLYTQIFKLSVERMPGLAFLVGSFIMLISILMCIYLHIKYLKYKNKMDDKKAITG